MRHGRALTTSFLAAITLLLACAGAAWAGAVNVNVSAVILSNHNCKFSSNAPVALAFGNLNPLVASDVTRTATIDFECNGNKNTLVAYGVSDDDGLYETGVNANRMKHLTLNGAFAYIPYTFSVSPTSGNTPLKTPVTLTITGTVFGPSYQSVYTGSYSDTVIVRIDP